MWQARKHDRHDSAMDSPLLAQPWTPPDMDVEASPHSDYFSDPFRSSPSFSAHIDKLWDRSPSRPETPARRHQRYDTPADLCDHLRPKPVERLTDPMPHTPQRFLSYSGPKGALRYPYTPDSSRILRRSTELPSSPPFWDQYSKHSSSPVQNALSSCLAHFENLIQSQQPDEDQMEYIVGQFEAMTSFLSAPDSQTKKTEEHLFAEADATAGARTGIADDDTRSLETSYVSKEAHDAYTAEVGRYIEGVKEHIGHLRMRLDEVKMLNSIQLDVIEDLRCQMRTVRQGLRTSLDMGDNVKRVEEELAVLATHANRGGRKDSIAPEKEFGLDSWETLVDGDDAVEQAATDETHDDAAPHSKGADSAPQDTRIPVVRTPKQRSFWAAVGEALDAVHEHLYEGF